MRRLSCGRYFIAPHSKSRAFVRTLVYFLLERGEEVFRSRHILLSMGRRLCQNPKIRRPNFSSRYLLNVCVKNAEKRTFVPSFTSECLTLANIGPSNRSLVFSKYLTLCLPGRTL